MLFENCSDEAFSIALGEQALSNTEYAFGSFIQSIYLNCLSDALIVLASNLIGMNRRCLFIGSIKRMVYDSIVAHSDTSELFEINNASVRDACRPSSILAGMLSPALISHSSSHTFKPSLRNLSATERHEILIFRVCGSKRHHECILLWASHRSYAYCISYRVRRWHSRLSKPSLANAFGSDEIVSRPSRGNHRLTSAERTSCLCERRKRRRGGEFSSRNIGCMKR